MLPLGPFQDRIVATRELPARPARTAPIPSTLDPALRGCLADRGLDELYVHQAEMFERAARGEDVVITTSTASGKSLGFLLPVLQAVVDDPAARILLIYPTKALAHDQLRGIQRLADGLRTGPGGGRQLEMGVYDGDTPPTERKRLRERANLVLTNPDLLNAGLLPAHGRAGFSHLFRNVRYVVIDELHVYRGAFGAHFSNLIRRLLRICAQYGSKPQFLASSATIANPGELAQRLCHRPFSVVDEDGSPSPGKVIHFWQPPLEADGTRRGVVSELTQLVPHLIKHRHKTIAFLRSRKETEVVLKEARDHLRAVDGGHDESDLLSAYRGGYTPEERRRIEQDLLEGRLLGVVSTNALELGVDIGQLEVVVQGGFPGTRASFWQQLGRAGRRGAKAHGLVVLASRPTDQFIAQDPEWLLDQEAEHAVVDPDNLTVQLAHIRAAAAELPLTLDDVGWFPDLGEVLPVLDEAGEVREVYGSWHWCGPAFPAGEFSLRNTDGDRFKVVDRDSQRVLTEMTRPQVYREAHTRAVYLHAGEEYLVEELDLVGHRAVVAPVDQNYYTQPDVRTHIEVLLTQDRVEVGRTLGWFGDVRVEDTVVGYKMLEFHNHQNLGYEKLHQELTTTLETEAVWIPVPTDVLAVLGERRLDALRGMIHAVRASARLKTMAERSDLLGTSFAFAHPETGDGSTALVCYDHHPGGIGFAAKAFDHLEEVLRRAVQLVSGCTCRDGCPACVGNYHLPRRLIAWGLESLFTASAPPADLAAGWTAAPGADTPLAPQLDPIPWDQVAARWDEMLERATADGRPGTHALQQVQTVRALRGGLLLHVTSPGLARWLGQEGPQRQLRAILSHHLALPEWFESDWRLEAEVLPDDQAEADRKRLKLRRRFEDLTGDVAETEVAANTKLASGFRLRDEP